MNSRYNIILAMVLANLSASALASDPSEITYHSADQGGASLYFDIKSRTVYAADIGTDFVVCEESLEYLCIDWSEFGGWAFAIPKDLSEESWSFADTEFRRVRRIAAAGDEHWPEFYLIEANPTDSSLTFTYLYSPQIGLVSISFDDADGGRVLFIVDRLPGLLAQKLDAEKVSEND